MTRELGFDNRKYLREQTAAILERVEGYSKLYLEFGGKLIFDYHAARVLPGFDPNVKMQLLQQLRDKIDVILCIYAGDIERRKIRADFTVSPSKTIARATPARAKSQAPRVRTLR